MITLSFLLEIPTWSWWVPWATTASGVVATHLYHRRSESFKELESINNKWKMWAEKLEKRINDDLIPEIEKMKKQNVEQAKQSDQHMKLIVNLQKETAECRERDEAKARQIDSLMSILKNDNEKESGN